MSTHRLQGAIRRRSNRTAAAAAQRGVSMMVSLVLLVVVTLIALGSMRGVVMQARMSGASHDRSLSFQAAEAALREAEARAALATRARGVRNARPVRRHAVSSRRNAPRPWMKSA